MMFVLLEDILGEELDEELGYSKYDYCNKDMDNYRQTVIGSRKSCQSGHGGGIPYLFSQFDPKWITEIRTFPE